MPERYVPMNRERFLELSRDDMVAELRKLDEACGTDLAVGKSRAKKSVIENLYKEGLVTYAKKVAEEEESTEEPEPDFNRNTETGRLSSSEPNLSNSPQPGPEEEEPATSIFLRRAGGTYYFLRPEKEEDVKRDLTSKELWLLERVTKLRDKIGPVYVNPSTGRRSNPSKHAKKEFRETVRKLLQVHNIVCVTDEAVKRMEEAQAQRAAS